MASAFLWGFMAIVGCSPIRRIPAPEPPQSRLPPTQARAHYARGQIWLAKGDLNRAQAALEHARVFAPDAPQILAALSQVALNRGDTDEARARAADAASLSETDPKYWLGYGRLEMAFGDRSVARHALNRALSMGGGWQARAALISDSIRQGQESELIDEWILEDVHDAIELRRRADFRLALDDTDGAMEDYFDVLRLSGRDLSLVSPIVSAASGGGRLAWTLIEAEAVCVDQPDASAAWLVVGLISGLLGDPDAAIEALERAQELGVKLGSGPRTALEKARSEKAVPVEPPSGRSSVLDDSIHDAIALVQQKRWEDGESKIRAGLERSPDDPRWLYILSDLYLKRDGPAAAREPVEKVLAVQPSYGPALNMWAWIHAEQGLALEEAEKRVMEALHLQPRVGSYWDTLGWIFHLRGHHAKARIALARALRWSPDDTMIREHLDACLSHGIEGVP